MSPAKHSARTTVTLLTPAGVSRETLRRWTRSARRRLGVRGRIEVIVVTALISRQLNRRYRRRDRPTNVLSFDYAHSRRSSELHPVDGEIILCPAVIRREAREQQRRYPAYFRFLVQHGLIHLLGLDHQTSQEQKVWTRFEQRLV